MIPQILAGLLALGFFPTSSPIITPQAPVVQTEKAPIVVTLPEELRRICSCESTGSPNNEPQHFREDGTVLRGKVNSDDTGMCQINLHYHGKRAISLGIDLFSEEGNKQYALLLYKEQGTRPWAWSKKCHGL